MIEVVLADRCVQCDICIKVCPTDVFRRGEDGVPVVAHQEDCQTCFMCEANCPTDALYVAPFDTPVPEDSTHTDADALAEAGALGAYRAVIGWGGGRTPGSTLDRNHLFAPVSTS
ncbi:4Fe-4S dicluster domain-containing protein [Rhodococcus koreensis]